MKTVFPPLLDAEELQALYHRASSAATSRPARPLQQRQAGELPSRHLGNGLDFADSRPYQPGDEPRFLDWRITARTGKPYSRQYHEERRPDVFVLLDRRSQMRFGTRSRLKVTQAARVAALVAFAALRQGWSVAGLVLEASPRWFQRSSDESSTRAFIRAGASSCPPCASGNEPALADILPLLTEQLQRGSHLYLLSDFADLDTGCEAHLLQLAQHHPLFAIHLLDTAECDLPAAGVQHVQGFDAALSQRVDLSSRALRQTFSQRASKLHDAREQQLKRLGCHYLRLMSDEESPENHLSLPTGGAA